MSWASATRKAKTKATPIAHVVERADVPVETIDWQRLVSLDFETYYDSDYTLSKLSTSEYIRDPRFKAQMVGIKVGLGKTKVVPAKRIAAELAEINWATHALLCHNTHFDGLILSHHYKIIPARYYCTMSMARGLHSNEIGAGLDEVSQFYGGTGKIEGALEQTKGVLNWSKALYDSTALYCANDVDEMHRIFCAMAPRFPAAEMQLIHMTMRMFCAPVLRVNIPRVQAEYEREVAHRERLMLDIIDQTVYYDDKSVLKTKAERELTGKERDMLVTKRVIGSNERFAELLRGTGVEAPVKISPAWISKSKAEQSAAVAKVMAKNMGLTPEEAERQIKWTYAFAKDDLKFLALPDTGWDYWTDLDPNDPSDILKLSARQATIKDLVETRLAVKSTTNITRAERFLKAGANGMKLPVGYAYARAHTLRWGGNNKMNMQNLTRGGELRLSIEADKGHQIAVCDSGQIEARVNGWLWDQNDLLEAFRKSDAYTAEVSALPKDKRRPMREDERDAYCRFADEVYGRTIWKADDMERFVGKVCVAEGELVLTHLGLVPIENITQEHRLWDGVEWVSHTGLIYQGIREVITYDGLTATPDHQVFVEDGRVIPLGQAASEMARLQVTGDKGRGLRFCDSGVVADTPRKRLSVRQGQMRPDWYYEADVLEQLKEREDDLVSEERTQAGSTYKSAGSTLRCNRSEVHQPEESCVVELRGQGDQVPVCDEDGVHTVGKQKSTAHGLRWGGDRPKEQQRALRTRELEVGDTSGASKEQTQHKDGAVGREENPPGRVSEPLQPKLDLEFIEPRNDGRRNPQKTRVYDIADAGPRKRFTVSGVLIFNCVLGLGYQMGIDKFQLTLARGALGGPPVVFPRDRCAHIVGTYRNKNHRIAGGWKICAEWIEHMATPDLPPIYYKCLEIGHGYILMPNGLTLKYPDLKQSVNDAGWDEWSYQSGQNRKKIYGGLLCENLVQCLARIIVAEQMIMIDKKYPVVMTTHDEAVTHPKTAQAQKAFDHMMTCMTTPLWWCPDIPLAAEGGFASNYSK